MAVTLHLFATMVITIMRRMPARLTGTTDRIGSLAAYLLEPGHGSTAFMGVGLFGDAVASVDAVASTADAAALAADAATSAADVAASAADVAASAADAAASAADVAASAADVAASAADAAVVVADSMAVAAAMAEATGNRARFSKREMERLAAGAASRFCIWACLDGWYGSRALRCAR
jgi:pyruvate/2-oxoglutarate dehydrogenase complex dihydrolipoamide acyltransferase (E2) component